MPGSNTCTHPNDFTGPCGRDVVSGTQFCDLHQVPTGTHKDDDTQGASFAIPPKAGREELERWGRKYGIKVSDTGPAARIASAEALAELQALLHTARAEGKAEGAREELETMETIIKAEIGKEWSMPRDTIGMKPADITKRCADWLLNSLRGQIQDRLATLNGGQDDE